MIRLTVTIMMMMASIGTYDYMIDMIGHSADLQSDTGRWGSGTYNSDFLGTWTVTLFQI
jgi:hypothetical protein